MLIDSTSPAGSLRRVATGRGIPFLLYEGGEPMRFNESAIEMGVNGVLRVLWALDMLAEPIAPDVAPSVEVTRTTWIRARQSGILQLDVSMGEQVKRRQKLGDISDPFGSSTLNLTAPRDGLVIGRTISPLVHRGDAVLHLATEIATH